MRYTLKRDDIPLLSQWIKKFDKLKLVEFFGSGTRIRTQTYRVRVCCATFTQFRYIQLLVLGASSACELKLGYSPLAKIPRLISTLTIASFCRYANPDIQSQSLECYLYTIPLFYSAENKHFIFVLVYSSTQKQVCQVFFSFFVKKRMY